MNQFADVAAAEQQSRAENCEKHGAFTSRLIFRDIWSKCPACNQEYHAGIVSKAQEKARRERAEAWQRKIGLACIPERFRDRTLDNYKAETPGQRAALAFAREYAENFDQVLETGRSAIFMGRPGTGKNHLATGIAVHIMAKGKLALFTTVQRMVRRVKDSWRNDSGETESRVIELMVLPDLLILDEIGVQFGSDFERNLLFDVLNERYERRNPTLLLTNLSQAEVREVLGERIFDRLREDGGQCIPFDWDSYRGAR